MPRLFRSAKHCLRANVNISSILSFKRRNMCSYSAASDEGKHRKEGHYVIDSII